MATAPIRPDCPPVFQKLASGFVNGSLTVQAAAIGVPGGNTGEIKAAKKEAAHHSRPEGANSKVYRTDRQISIAEGFGSAYGNDMLYVAQG